MSCRLSGIAFGDMLIGNVGSGREAWRPRDGDKNIRAQFAAIAALAIYAFHITVQPILNIGQIYIETLYWNSASMLPFIPKHEIRYGARYFGEYSASSRCVTLRALKLNDIWRGVQQNWLHSEKLRSLFMFPNLDAIECNIDISLQKDVKQGDGGSSTDSEPFSTRIPQERLWYMYSEFWTSDKKGMTFCDECHSPLQMPTRKSCTASTAIVSSSSAFVLPTLHVKRGRSGALQTVMFTGAASETQSWYTVQHAVTGSKSAAGYRQTCQY